MAYGADNKMWKVMKSNEELSPHLGNHDPCRTCAEMP